MSHKWLAILAVPVVGAVGAWTLWSLHPASSAVRSAASASSRPSPVLSVPPSASSAAASSLAPSSLPSSSPSASASSVPVSVAWVTVPMMLGGNSFGTLALPSSWSADPTVTDGGGSGATLVWSSPSSANSLNVQVSSAYGTNHNVANGTDAFDPSLALPQSGCAITADESTIFPFTCQGFQGFVYSSPAVAGAVTVWTAGPNGSELGRVLNSVQLSSSVLSSAQGG